MRGLAFRLFPPYPIYAIVKLSLCHSIAQPLFDMHMHYFSLICDRLMWHCHAQICLPLTHGNCVSQLNLRVASMLSSRVVDFRIRAILRPLLLHVDYRGGV